MLQHESRIFIDYSAVKKALTVAFIKWSDAFLSTKLPSFIIYRGLWSWQHRFTSGALSRSFSRATGRAIQSLFGGNIGGPRCWAFKMFIPKPKGSKKDKTQQLLKFSLFCILATGLVVTIFYLSLEKDSSRGGKHYKTIYCRWKNQNYNFQTPTVCPLLFTMDSAMMVWTQRSATMMEGIAVTRKLTRQAVFNASVMKPWANTRRVKLVSHIIILTYQDIEWPEFLFRMQQFEEGRWILRWAQQQFCLRFWWRWLLFEHSQKGFLLHGKMPLPFNWQNPHQSLKTP